MAFADSSVYFGCGDGSIIGQFREEEHGNIFEFSRNLDYVEPNEDVHRFLFTKETDITKLFPHLVWVIDEGHFMRKHMSPVRYAKVMKTRAHVVVDEDENGLVIEVWKFKNAKRTIYERT